MGSLWLNVKIVPSLVMHSYLSRRLLTLTRMSSYRVQHDANAKEFYIALGNDKAQLQYEKEGNNVLNMYHTGVPEELRGKGIAGYLAKAALDFAVERDFKVKLTCSYLQHYVEKHPAPEYKERIIPL